MSHPAPISDQQIADKITQVGLHWTTNTLTYSFNNTSTAGNALDATQQAWITSAVAMISETFNINIVLTAGVGNITFNGSSGDGTYTSLSWGGGQALASANIFFDQSWTSNQTANLTAGSSGILNIEHELGHALGLEHPGNYNGAGVTYANNAEFLQDTQRYSYMSYFDSNADESGSVFFNAATSAYLYPQTPMVYDILAMTSGSFAGLFGGYSLNTATRATATSYGYNATAGINSVFDFTSNTAPVLTIYDAGGIDVLDMSGDTVTTAWVVNYAPHGTVSSVTTVARTSSVIDLREGQYSSTNGMTNNIGIAFGTVIENAIGTGFNDTIYGNNVANSLFGGAGTDNLFGDAGNDKLYSTNASQTGDAGVTNYLWGGAGDDSLYGAVGVDVLIGGAGNDSFFGGAGDDWMYVDEFDTSISGGAGFDRILINTNAATFTLNVSATGAESVFGGAEADILSAAGYNTTVWLQGGGGIDTLTGGNAVDVLSGGAQNDTLFGGLAIDWLYGGANSDTLNGGLHDDFLIGNMGGGGDGVLDTYVFDDNWGTDRIYDFDDNIDIINMSSVTGLTSFGQLTISAADGGINSSVVFGGDTIFVMNITAAQLTAADFLV